jgi:hypothetical protein
VNLLSRHGPLLSSVFGDPSVIRRHVPPEKGMAAIAVLETILAGSTEPIPLLRARCALGALFSGVHGIAQNDTRFTEPPRGEQVARLLNREEELLDAEQRQEIVAAALRALGPSAGAGPDCLPGSSPASVSGTARSAATASLPAESA